MIIMNRASRVSNFGSGEPGSPAGSGAVPLRDEGPRAPGSASVADLLDQNLRWLRGWLGAQLQGAQGQEVDDACQDIVVRALTHFHKLRDPSKFSAWLYRIAGNVVRDYRRRAARSSGRRELLPDDVADSARVDRALETGEELQFVTKKLLALPRRYREPMLLRHVDDLSYAEIGRILGISENTVHVRIFRARKLLREACRGHAVGSSRRSEER